MELADFEFNTLAAELDSYAREVTEKAARGDLDLELDATTIDAVLNAIATKFTSCVYKKQPIKASVIQELIDFGSPKASDLDALFTDKLVSGINQHVKTRTSLGLIRLAMFWHDLEKYFSKVWKKDWKVMTDETYRLLTDHYGKEKLDNILAKHSVSLLSSIKTAVKK